MGVSCGKKKVNEHIKNENFFNKTQFIRVFDKHSFSVPEESENVTFDSLTTNKGDINDHYDIEETVVGEGYFGKVRRAKMKGGFTNVFAVKSITKAKLIHEMNIIASEINCLKTLDHPNVVNFYESFQDEDHFHIILEFLSGGELINKIEKETYMNEKKTKAYFYQVLKIINHMHGKGICHRDIKPENFLLSSSRGIEELKIVDFGLSKRFILEDGKIRLFALCGSPYYVAPEVLTGDYDEKIDLWSAGIMLYYMLTLQMPFAGKIKNQKDFYKQILRGNIDFKNPMKKHNISKNARDLCQKLLIKSPFLRISISQALNHPWFSDQEIPKTIFFSNDMLMEKLRNFKKLNYFKKVVYIIISKFLARSELRDYKNMFKMIDKDGDGIISFPEFKYYLIKNNISCSNEEISEIIESLRHKIMHHIFYSEFIAVCISDKDLDNSSFLKGLFKYMCQGNTEMLHYNSIKYFFNYLGQSFSNDDLTLLLYRYGISNRQCKDGISFEEFKTLLTGEETHKDSYELTLSTNKGHL